jgi:hypothetical protein
MSEAPLCVQLEDRIVQLELENEELQRDVKFYEDDLVASQKRETRLHITAIMALRRAKVAEAALEEAENKLQVAKEVEERITGLYEDADERAGGAEMLEMRLDEALQRERALALALEEARARAAGLEHELGETRVELAGYKKDVNSMLEMIHRRAK